MDQRAAQPELLLHSPRKLACRPIHKRRQAGGSGQRRDAPVPFAPVMTEQARKEREVFGDRQRRIEIASQSLRHIGDPRQHPASRGSIAHIDTQRFDAAGLDLTGAGDEREQTRLAHAVRTDQPHHVAGRQIERDTGQCLYRTIAQGHIHQARRGCARPAAHGCGFVRSASGQGVAGSRRT